ncbi:cornifelin homolog [Alosa pseudoharengus]|uniref:cornifelin homolog n=1 Tax=Alosa pseudoharengus TaxID=34774 RepID=UPI003F8BC221
MAVYPAVTLQPGMFRSPENLKTEPWVSGLFDCCEDMGICCFGFWCLPCLMCRTSQEMGEGLCLPLVDMLLAAPVPPIALALRVSVRERNRIQGSVCDDCCMVTCCMWCVWCQMAREVRKRRQPLPNNAQITVCATAPQASQPPMVMPLHMPMYPPPYPN